MFYLEPRLVTKSIDLPIIHHEFKGWDLEKGMSGNCFST